jgi:hypothetical protein
MKDFPLIQTSYASLQFLIVITYVVNTVDNCAENMVKFVDVLVSHHHHHHHIVCVCVQSVRTGAKAAGG